VASNYAGAQWDNTLASTSAGQWSIGQITDNFGIGLKVTQGAFIAPNTSVPLATQAPNSALIFDPTDGKAKAIFSTGVTRTFDANVADSANTYVVQKGDSLWKIATTNGWDLETLKAANPQLTDPNFINIGQKINGLGPARDLSTLSTSERNSYGLYSKEEISERLEQLGLADSAQFDNSGFSGTGAANASLDNYQFSAGGEDYYFINGDAGLSVSSDSAYGPGVGDDGQSCTVSGSAAEAIGDMGGATNWVSPLILDLDGDGVAADLTHAYKENVYFDIDNDNFAERVGWSNGQDGLLAFDANGNGEIDNITELFGDDQMAAFQKLRGWDSNGDGQISASDKNYSKLKLWQDKNKNGRTDQGELTSLDKAGVLSISTADQPYLQSPYASSHGITSAYAQENYLSSATTFQMSDATGAVVTREIADVHFMNDNLNTWQLGAHSQVAGAEVKLNLQALMLPLSRGYGSLPSLHLAMTENPELLQQVAQLAGLKADQLGSAAARVDAILLEWAGVSKHDPNARVTAQGSYMDARQVDFLERFTGVTWAQRGATGFVGEDASLGLKKAWAGIEQMMLNRLLIQGPLQAVFSQATYDFATDTVSLGDSLVTLLTRAQAYAAQIGPTGAGQGEFWRQLGGILAEHHTQLGASVEQINTALRSTSGLELFLQEITLSAADGPLYTGKDGTTEAVIAYAGGAGADTITGSGANDYLFGKQGDDNLAGGGGDDFMRGDAGDDTLDGGAGFDKLEGGDGNDRLYGGADSDVLVGGAGADLMDGGAGDDLVEGGAGADVLDGGEGLDTLRTNTAGSINLATGVASGGDLTGDVFVNFENIDGSGYADVLTGDSKNNFINGEGGDDILSGGAGNDFLWGAWGNNQLYGEDGDDLLMGYDGVDLMDGGNGYDTVSYNHPYLAAGVNGQGVTVDLMQGKGLGGIAAGDTLLNIEAVVGTVLQDQITGNDAANTLDGQGGADGLYGLGGNDRLLARAQGEHLFGGAGSDTFVILPAAGALPNSDTANADAYTSYIHDFSASDSSEKIDLSAQALKQVLLRQRGADAVIALANSRELVLLNVDVAQLSVADFVLPSGVSQLTIGAPDGSSVMTVTGDAADNTLYGGSGSDALNGLAGNDTLVGGTGDDQLNGGLGNDSLQGGRGSDMYTVDTLLDVITENADEGMDTVNVDIATAGGSYTLGSHLENARLASTVAYSLNGNELDNSLTGNNAGNTLSGGAGDDVLDGLGGADALVGGTGNDTYTVDTLLDAITENAAEGIDTVNVAIATAGGTYTLGTNLENALIKSTVAYSLSGNALDNTLTGNAAANTLAGGDGNDTLRGGDGNDVLNGEAGDDTLNGEAGDDSLLGSAGDDLYVVNTLGDQVIENTGEGTDTVNSAISYALGANVENLTLLAYATALSGSGNALNNVLIGNNNNNTLSGGEGNDALYGNGGSDLIYGGAGDDILDGGVGDYVTNTLNGDAGNDTLLFRSFVGSGVYNGGDGVDVLDFQTNIDEGRRITGAGVSVDLVAGKAFTYYRRADNFTAPDSTEFKTTLLLTSIENLSGTEYGDILSGDANANNLKGNGGSDLLNGGAGKDSLDGGASNDATIATLDTLNGDDGDDVLWSRGFYGAGIYNGGAGVDWLDFSQPDADTAQLRGTEGVGVVVGLGAGAGGVGGIAYTWRQAAAKLVKTGSNTTLALNGIENVRGTAAADFIVGHAGANVIEGDGGNDSLVGLDGNDTLSGGAGNDVLDGGSGADTLVGGAGDDGYTVDDVGDTVTELADEGTDTVNASVTYTLGANLENLTLTGAAAINGTGNTANNVLTGNAAANTLDGGLGQDLMTGGAGNDLYLVENGQDVVTEAFDEGIDTVQSTITYTLTANVENLYLLGSSDANGTGNSLNNQLIGNASNNTLDGAQGADTLIGGTGNDTYTVDDVGDVVTELANEGTDTVQSYLTSTTLAANVENLTLLGSLNANGTGNALNNTLLGNDAANVLNGGAGADALTGGMGDDVLQGGWGNDTLTGGAGDDVMDRATPELLKVYAVNTTGGMVGKTYLGTDQVAEVTLSGGWLPSAKAGQTLQLSGTSSVDKVYVTAGSSMDATQLGAGVDEIYLTGRFGDYAATCTNTAITLTRQQGLSAGQAEVVKLSGGSAVLYDNVYFADGFIQTSALITALKAGTAITLNTSRRTDASIAVPAALSEGADTLAGGTGNDTYTVDDVGDVVTELANEGVDTVQSYLANTTLADNVENLVLLGGRYANGTGNDLNNTLTGNSGSNLLDGRAGADILVGGTGNDAYVLGRGDGSDTIEENDATLGNIDVARFEAGIDASQLWFAQSGNNLEVSVIGTDDGFTVSNWYLGEQHHVEQFKTSGGLVLLDSQVNSLVQAMAGFAPPAMGETSLTAAMQTTLAPALAASWQ
jgi:Ca2+-binding RTX toxin-like protein/LysM repeat protein